MSNGNTRLTLSEALARGFELQKNGNPAAAVELYMRVIAGRPEHAEAWCYLGMGLHDLRRYSESEDAYLQALKLNPKFPVALNNLGNTLRMLDRSDEAIEAFDSAISLKPGYLNAIRNRATAHYWIGEFESAERGFLEVLAQEPEDADARKDLGVLRILTGRFREGWPDYEYRWKTSVGGALPKLPGERWTGGPIAGKTLMILGEQGLGDTVQFVRYGRQLVETQGCKVIAQVPDTLVPLLSANAEHLGLEKVVPKSGPLPKFDYWVPMLSLPGVLDQDSDEFPTDVPYLASDELDPTLANLLSGFPGLKVGVAWQGNPAHQADVFRSFPLDALAPLARLEGVTLFSLQKGDGTEQVAQFGEALGLVDLGPRLDEGGTGAFTGTAALMRHLDLVVTLDSAVAHVAGALGVPVWLALSHVPDWRWGLNSEVSSWYPTTRLFRQPDPGNWSAVFNEMAAELARLRKRLVFHPIPTVPQVQIPIPPGELVDRITILEVKEERISNPEKLRHVRSELAELRKVQAAAFGEVPIPEIAAISIRLARINRSLWDSEDTLRQMESKKDFSESFIGSARSIYRLNDRRAELKRELNNLLGASWQEVKSYTGKQPES